MKYISVSFKVVTTMESFQTPIFGGNNCRFWNHFKMGELRKIHDGGSKFKGEWAGQFLTLGIWLIMMFGNIKNKNLSFCKDLSYFKTNLTSFIILINLMVGQPGEPLIILYSSCGSSLLSYLYILNATTLSILRQDDQLERYLNILNGSLNIHV